MKNHPTSKVNFMCCMVLLQYLRCMQIQARLSQRCWCRKVENMNYPWWKNMWVLRMCLVNSGSPMLCGINSKLLELRTWKTYNHALAVRGTCRRLKEEEASQVSSECRPVQSRFLDHLWNKARTLGVKLWWLGPRARCGWPWSVNSNSVITVVSSTCTSTAAWSRRCTHVFKPPNTHTGQQRNHADKKNSAAKLVWNSPGYRHLHNLQVIITQWHSVARRSAT